MKRYLSTSIFASFVSAAALYFLFSAGRDGRIYGPGGIYTVERAEDAASIFRETGGRGRVAVCLSLSSRSSPLDDAGFMVSAPYAYRPVDMVRSFSGSIDEKNLLWVMMMEGVVRKVLYAVPEGEWEGISKRIAGRVVPPPIDMNYRGSQIFIYTMKGLPPLDETVLLFIDGAVYNALEPSRIYDFIKRKGLSYDMALLSSGPEGKMAETASLLRGGL